MPAGASLDTMNSLYVHIPFCVDRCSYCDFYSTKLDDTQVRPYLDALALELERRAAGRAFDTIFIGGGTPTSIREGMMERMLSDITSRVTLRPGGEFSCEANPGTVTPAKAALLKAAGVNRVSMGAQSFQPAILASMRRIHSPAQVVESVRALRAAGIDNLNLDLIFAYPGQDLAMLRDDLAQAAALEPAHLSSYALSFEEGTALHSQLQAGRVRETDEDTYAAMYDALLEGATAMGMEQYEISNFARPGFHCRHNYSYWNYTEYTGVGVSAWSFEGGRRFGNLRNMAEYMRRMLAGRPGHDEAERLEGGARAGEAAVMKLRTLDGIDRAWWDRVAGDPPLDAVARRLAKHMDAGLMAWDGERLRLTRRGLFVSNSILLDCLELEPAEAVHE